MKKLLLGTILSVALFQSILASAVTPPVSVDPQAQTAMLNLLNSNLQQPSIFTPFYHAYPAPKYPGVYLWDSAFIAQIWKWKNIGKAKDVLRSVLYGQEDSGRVPHVRSLYNGSSPLIQPPLLGWSAWRLYMAGAGDDYIKEVYPELLKFHKWMDANRRHPNGLYFWIHPYESGLDNSPRFSNTSESEFDDTTKLVAVDLSSYMAMDSDALANMAHVIGNAQDEQQLRAEFASIKGLMNSLLWDAGTNRYYDLDLRTNKLRPIDTIAGLTPLAAGIADADKGALLVKAVEDPKNYNTVIPFPSVSRADPLFQKDCWRGPVWINMAYLSYIGLKRYGEMANAVQMGAHLVSGVYATWRKEGSFYEYYDPDQVGLQDLTRKKGNMWKQVTLGSKPVGDFVGWTGLIYTFENEATQSEPGVQQ